MALASLLSDRDDRRKVVRGTDVMSLGAANAAGRKFGSPTSPLIGADIPDPMRLRTMIVQGSQGTGKTLTILDALLPRLLAMADPNSCERLVIVDLKGDVTSAVLGARKVICPDVPVVFLNPFERFGQQPDPHEFTRDPTQINRLVEALTYRRRDARTDDFFDSVAKLNLVTLIKILQDRVPGRWTWRHLYHLATDYRLHTRVLKKSRLGRQKAGPLVKKMFVGIVATIDSWLGQYESAFACWSQSPPVKLDEFLRGRGIMIISAPEDQRESLAPVIRTVLKVTRDRLLADTGRNRNSQTTIVLDEFADLVDCVSVILPFFGKSRSAQVALICAWQSWSAVCEAHGEGAMRSVLDNAGVRVWLACGSDSSKIASDNCSAAETRRPDWSYAYGEGDGVSFPFLSPRSATVNLRTELRTNVLPSEIMGLGFPTPGDLTIRAFITAGHLPGPVYCEQDCRPLIEYMNRLPHVPPYRPRPSAQMRLAPFDMDTDGLELNELFVREE